MRPEQRQLVLAQLERLRRNHAAAHASGDLVALLDLSHILRIWMDYRQPLIAAAPQFSSTIAFKAARPTKPALRILSQTRAPFVLAHFTGGIRTAAASSMIATAPPNPGDISLAASVMRLADGGLEIGSFRYLEATLPGPEQVAADQAHVERKNYSQWLSAEAVRLAIPIDGVLTPMIVSRETIVRRVANAMDGSHPSLDAVTTDPNDPIIRLLMNLHVGGLPLPYFILLKIADDILATAPRLLGLVPVR